MTVTPAPADLTLITFDDTTLILSVSGTDIFDVSGSYLPGSYTVEIRAWADNNVDTGYTITITVDVVDPCDLSTITILPAIVTPNPISYKLMDPTDTQVLQATVTSVTESETTVNCPLIVFEVKNTDMTTTLDTLFTWDSPSQTLTTYSID